MIARQKKFIFLKKCILFSGIFSVAILYHTGNSFTANASTLDESSQLHAASDSIETEIMNPLNPTESVIPITREDKKDENGNQFKKFDHDSNLQGIPNGKQAIKIFQKNGMSKETKKIKQTVIKSSLSNESNLLDEPSFSGGGEKTTEKSYIEEVFADFSGVVLFGIKQRV